jgi:AmpE protein
MSFLTIIIALLLVQAWGSGSRVQHDDWFLGWRGRIGGWGFGPWPALVLAVLAPAVVAYFVLDALRPLFFGLLWIALAVILLLYSFGRGDFHDLMARYQGQSRSGDFEAAYLTTLSELGWSRPGDEPVSPEQVHALVQRGFAYEGYQRWFATLFYFLLLGPAGALAYRLLQLCRREFQPDIVERCLFVVDWLPARLLAAAFALAGDFVGCRDKLLDCVLDGSADAAQLLYDVGMASLGVGSVPPGEDSAFAQYAAGQSRELGSLLSRSAACWVAIISMMVLLL